LLALQGLVASVGFGMAAASTADQIDFVICDSAAGHSAATPAGDRDTTDHRPQCPFCFVAAQSGGLLTKLGDAVVVPADAVRAVSTLRYGILATRIVASPLRRSNGNPRAPPRSSV